MTMRVAHIITRMILGGAQENTLLNCRDLIRQYGDDVLLITGPTDGLEGTLMEKVRNEGIPYRQIDTLRRPIRPWRDLRACAEIRSVLSRFSPQVVHTHSAKGGILGRYAAASLNIPAIIHTVHGAPFYDHQSASARWLYRQCERRAAAKCHHIISVADAMTQLMVEGGVAPQSKFTTVYSGMDVGSFCNSKYHRAVTRTALGYEDDEIVVGKIARLFHLKGHPYLLEAAREIVTICPQVRFMLVGGGTLRQHYERQISRFGLSQYFKFMGLVPAARIPALVSAMDILVHTSLREGLARALPQALLAQRPVVSFDLHGAREVVMDGITGLLVQPGDVAGLARAVIELTKDPSRREVMGKRGQQTCKHRFDHLSMTREVRSIYEKILKNHRELSEKVTIR